MNRLSGEASPYLLQHADNPVHWWPWSDAALDEAKKAGKPILLSVGYAACHWCHVMAHESFEDDEVAAVMNDLFINIKVDREERPDIDQLYMSALHHLGQHGGWPLTMFLTPDAEPFWGGTYFPRTSRHGMPGFIDVMQAVHRTYTREPERVDHNRSALRTALTAKAKAAEGTLSPDLLDDAAARLLQIVDPINGGIGQEPKFPNIVMLDFLWQWSYRTGQPSAREAVLTALDGMCLGGIYDHVGGGFARYAVDAKWHVPHFEKMLYDNALITRLLVRAWHETGRDLYRVRIEETITWLEREMIVEGGAFAASLDADSEGVEGKFYVWTPDQITAALSEDEARLFSEIYDISPAGNWEGVSIPNLLALRPIVHDPTNPVDQHHGRLRSIRDRLLKVREERIRPGRDDKVLTDWNGLMIAALAEAGRAFGNGHWLALAQAAYRFISESMTDGDRLAHAAREDKRVYPGMATDYANMIDAALTLREITRNTAYLEDALRWTGALEHHHREAGLAGYTLAANDATDILIRMRSATDDATPNANPIMVRNLVRLTAVTGDSGYAETAEEILASWTDDILGNPFSHTALLAAFDMMLEPIDIVISGDSTSPSHVALVDAATTIPDPNRMISVIPPGMDLPTGHPAAGKGSDNGTPQAYVCIGRTCSLPVTDPQLLKDNADRSKPRAVTG